MTKFLPSRKLLLYYSTTAALFFTLSGFFSVKETKNVTLQIVFLPVTMYLFLAVSKDIKQSLFHRGISDPTTPVKSVKKGPFVFFGILFLILLMISLLNIFQANKMISPLPDDAAGRNSGAPLIFDGEEKNK